MLHAFSHNKSQAYHRYARRRDADEPRVCAEDEITSLIFGPLDLLCAADNWALWKTILEGHETTTVSGPLPESFFAASFVPVSCTMTFWCRRDGIEPDLLIDFADAEARQRSLLVELKWDSPLSGQTQLQRQWSEFQRGQHDVTLHLFLAKSLIELPDPALWLDTDALGVSRSRLRGLRWQEFQQQVANLTARSTTSLPLKKWGIQAVNFLSLSGMRPFVGFYASMHLARTLPQPSLNAARFWHP